MRALTRMFALPLAWLQLTREKLRLLVAVAGVAFAVVLIFMQLGFRDALIDGAVRFHQALNADVVLISPHCDFIAQPKTFSRRRLLQALTFAGVDEVTTVYLGNAIWTNPENGRTRSIFAIGVDPGGKALQFPTLHDQIAKIHMPDVVLFDEASRPEYGSIEASLRSGTDVATEINHRRVTVRGLFAMGTSFGIDGTVITSDLNFRRLFPQREEGVIDVGVVRLHPGVDPAAVRDAMTASLPNDVLVLTKQDFIEREKHYWTTSTPVGYVFAFGVVMGFVVGAIIVYQILFAGVSDHLTEYATLKAIGYSNLYLFSVVLQQAVILSVLGFIPGMLASTALYRAAATATRLPLNMTAELGTFVFLLAVVMCGISGAIALRKIRSADPAEIF